MYEHRVDYVKVAMSLHSENAMAMADVWYSTFEGEGHTDDMPRSAHVNSVRNNPDGTRLYVFEAWGEACSHVSELDVAVWGPHLDRLDVRAETEVTRKGIDRLYGFIRENKRGTRNITLYDSKARSKRKGRDTGGYGIALGSHKSDMRITWYVRGSGGGAMEFQVAGDKLERTVSVYLNMFKTGSIKSDAECWRAIQVGVYAMGITDIASVTGLDTYNLSLLLKNEQAVEEETEQKLAAIDAMLDELDKEALHAVMNTVQLRLV